MDKTAE